MITLTIQEALAAQPALQEMMNTPLPRVAAFKFSRIGRKLNDEMKDFETARVNAAKNFGTEDGKGGFKVEAAALRDFAKELEPLMGVTLTLDAATVSIEEMGDAAVKPAALLSLEKFITE